MRTASCTVIFNDGDEKTSEKFWSWCVYIEIANCVDGRFWDEITNFMCMTHMKLESLGCQIWSRVAHYLKKVYQIHIGIVWS